jgi:Ankyrin repeat
MHCLMDDEIISLLVGKLLAPVPCNQFQLWRSFKTFDYSNWWDGDGSLSYKTYDTNPLHWAACFGLEEVCKRLLKYGIDANSASQIGHPLCCAILGIDVRDRSCISLRSILECIPGTETESCAKESVIKLLLSAGADLEKKECFYMDDSLSKEVELQPLSLAIRLELSEEPKIFETLINY